MVFRNVNVARLEVLKEAEKRMTKFSPAHTDVPRTGSQERRTTIRTRKNLGRSRVRRTRKRIGEGTSQCLAKSRHGRAGFRQKRLHPILEIVENGAAEGILE